MSDICPFTGVPCSLPKSYKVTDIRVTKEIKHVECCQECIQLVDTPIPSIDKKNKPNATMEEVFENMFGDIFKIFDFVPQNAKLIHVEKKNSPQCPNCGLSLKELGDKGRFGCDHCYKFFGESANNILKSYHGSIRHVGKVPKKFKQKKQKITWEDISIERIDKDLAIANLKMQNAIKVENYESAAEYKSIIQSLSKGKEAKLDASIKEETKVEIIDSLLQCENKIL